MPVQCLIVEDEPLAAGLIISYLEKLPQFSIAGTCSNALEAFSMLQNKSIDLLFLDINMPKMNGIELLRSLTTRPPVIFTTAYREYASEGFEMDAVDYLVKPISFERFLKAIGKFQKQNQLVDDELKASRNVFDEMYMYFKVNKEMVKIYLKDILFIESVKDYVKINTADKSYLTYQRISYLEAKLPEEKFMRVHKSYIVALDKISGLNSHTLRINATEIPVGRIYKMNVMRILQ